MIKRAFTGILVCGLFLFCLMLSGCKRIAAEAAGRETGTVLRESDAYTVRELSLQRDGQKIYGNLYLPNTEAETYPLAILAHGFGVDHTVMEPYAAVLAENGIAAYVFDFCGGSKSSRSDGDILQMSVLTEREDMAAVLDQLCSEAFVDQNNIFLIGESQGGFVAALLAAQQRDKVQGLALLYPAFVIPDDARAKYADAAQIPDTSRVMGVRVGRTYFADVLDMDVYKEITPFDKNVLIVHGNRDTIVPIAYSEQAVEQYPSAQLIVLDGAKHGFAGKDETAAAEEALKFMQENFQ